MSNIGSTSTFKADVGDNTLKQEYKSLLNPTTLDSKDVSSLTKLRDQNESSILHYICKVGNERCMIDTLNHLRKQITPNELVKFINTQDKNGDTAMFVAVSNGNNVIAGMLELFGADRNIKNKNNDILTDTSPQSVDSQSSLVIHRNNPKELNKLFERITRISDSPIVEENNLVQSGGNFDHIDDYELDKEINNLQNKLIQMGGAKKTIKVADKNKTASEIHEEVLTMIRDLGYSDEESKIIKAGLYSYTKEQHPDLKNYDRALKMKEYTKKKYIKNIDVEAMKQAIKIHNESKSQKSTSP